jgi:predicted RNA-binding protein with PIN domain
MAVKHETAQTLIEALLRAAEDVRVAKKTMDRAEQAMVAAVGDHVEAMQAAKRVMKDAQQYLATMEESHG